MNLSRRLMLYFLLVAFLPTILLALFTSTIIGHGEKEEARKTINNNLKTVQAQYNARVYQMKYGMLQASTELHIKSAIRRKDKASLRKQLKAWKEYRPHVDLWTIVGPDAVTIAAHNTPVSGINLSVNGLVEKAIESRQSIVSTEIISGEMLVTEGLAERAAIPGAGAEGMFLVVVTPVTDNAGDVLGAIVTADLINHDTFVPDTSAEMIPDAFVSIAMGARVISTNVTGESGLRSVGAPVPPHVLDELGPGRSFRGESTIAGKDYIVAYDSILNHRGDVIGSISVGLPKERFAELQSAYVKGLIGIAVLALFMASGVGAFIAYMITRPIESLTRRARRVSAGDLRPRMPLHTEGSDEIAELARTFEGMLRNLKENEERISAGQAKLSRQKNLVESIINSLPYCIYVLEKNLAIIDWNSHALQQCPICRCSPEVDCHGLNFIEHLPPHGLRDGLAEVIRSVFETGVPRHLEQGLTIDGPAGKEAYVRTSIFPILSQTGFADGERVDYVVWMAEDITEKKDMEANIITSEKLSAVGELAAGVAHEVNNPLGGILNCLDNFKNRPLSDERKAEYLEFMKDGIVRVQNIVGQLLDFSQQHVPELRSVDINSIIEEIKPLFAHTIKERKIRIVTDFDRTLKPILADKHQMEQILVNLTLNAIQAVDGDGLIEISTKAMRSWCCITVRDNGSGIPAGDMPRIFNPFFTTKGVGKGTGLGLSVSRGIIEQHKGRIEVESRVGVGTVFKVYLPLSA
jgi:signal transduction histidine kinase/HAMP domain-containing protein